MRKFLNAVIDTPHAGFQVRVADSPHRVDQLKRLPPDKFVSRVRNGQKVYLFADPAGCNCVY